MKQPIKSGRPKLAPEDKKRACSVILSPKQEEAIKDIHGSLTKAILSTQNMRPIKITYSDGSTKEFMANTDAFDMPNPVVSITKIEMFYNSTKAILTTINK